MKQGQLHGRCSPVLSCQNLRCIMRTMIRINKGTEYVNWTLQKNKVFCTVIILTDLSCSCWISMCKSSSDVKSIVSK